MLFQLGLAGGYAVVHLTWRGQKEPPVWPWMQRFASWQALQEQVLGPDHLEYQAEKPQ